MHNNAKDGNIQNPFYFREKVEKGGDWDFKNQEGIYCSNKSCGGQEHASYIFLGSEIDYDAPGNINYGYVGSNAWFGSSFALHYFANEANNKDNNVSGGDSFSDKHYINYGIKLFRNRY